MLKVLNKTIADIEIEDRNEKKDPKEVLSTLSTYRSEQKINLNTLRTESILSKDISSRNFRVKTMVQADEPVQENDHEYDQAS